MKDSRIGLLGFAVKGGYTMANPKETPYSRKPGTEMEPSASFI
jgi:hypothetical protein